MANTRAIGHTRCRGIGHRASSWISPLWRNREDPIRSRSECSTILTYLAPAAFTSVCFFIRGSSALSRPAPYTHLLHRSQLDDAQPIPPHPGPLPREREDHRQSDVLAMF